MNEEKDDGKEVKKKIRKLEVIVLLNDSSPWPV